jgi:AcrR family transcriptional regulator
MEQATTLKTQQSDATRALILAAALKLFAKRGFTSTSVDEIAQQAGITKGAVYWHFGSKEDLFSAILDRVRERWQAMILRPVSIQTSPRKQLEQMFECYEVFFGEAPATCLFLQRELLEDDSVFSPQVGRIFCQTARFIAKILESGQAKGVFRRDLSSLVTAHQIIGALSGASQQALARRSLPLGVLIREVKKSVLARVLVLTQGTKSRWQDPRSRLSRQDVKELG